MNLTVDSHAHTGKVWFEPIEALAHQMDRHGVDRAVLVQTSGRYDNGYQQDAAQAAPDRFASVVVVDQTGPHGLDDLRRLAGEGSAGVRLSPTVAGSDAEAWWQLADELGLVVSTLGRPSQFTDPGFATLLESLPGLHVVIEHLGSRRKAAHELTLEAAEKIAHLARRPRLHLKFHGLGEISERLRPLRNPPFGPTPPLLRMLFDAFGPDRMMWGSDFPPVSSREGYGTALSLPRDELRSYGATDSELAAMFGGNAARLFWPAA